ncbi:cysteine-rich receptor-like protein kinase 10 isoform X2 [Ananas comosus]|uniref:non-specific serine/threonine protein kinase n=1 Tax=Ananas comosus TaxID=4615 RepID=A0A6P5GMP5_ANACO|nr:cysteine-rich receptor-like protein kinase 10 isoform X2 [Ananas comosus]
MSLCTYLLVKYIKKRTGRRIRGSINNASSTSETADLSPSADTLGNDIDDPVSPDSPMCIFEIIAASTDNFKDKNKLGEGGFGPVYKGRLSNGEEIAVKRLSKHSSQGINEFRNEVELISKLQHRNLVRLLGCCVKGEEKLLIYEFMSNKSLAVFLFDETKQGMLDWKRRYNIVEGVARGLLYLHRDSRLKIIHRDLKASNILLDDQFNPKISDFGTARIFGGDQTRETTSRVIGTIGYMSPEYAMEGQISDKSDVFSFGVLLLEIVSGKRNNYFLHDDQALNLVGYAWTLWAENRILELIDPSLGDSWDYKEVCKCIKVGLLCVQEYPIDRPNMSLVVSMLNSDTILPDPKRAAFFAGRSNSEAVPSTNAYETSSVNGLTITNIDSR